MPTAGKRITVTLPTWIYRAIDARACKYDVSFSRALSDVLTPSLDIPEPAAGNADSKSKKLGMPPIRWEGDPNDDFHYVPPDVRMAGYRKKEYTDKKIYELEQVVLAKWPRATTIYDEGLDG